MAEEKIQVLFKLPKSIHRSFKIACIKNDKAMTQVICNFMSNYAKANDTYKQVIAETELNNVLDELQI